jgi:hypothetical protein
LESKPSAPARPAKHPVAVLRTLRKAQFYNDLLGS